MSFICYIYRTDGFWPNQVDYSLNYIKLDCVNGNKLAGFKSVELQYCDITGPMSRLCRQFSWVFGERLGCRYFAAALIDFHLWLLSRMFRLQVLDVAILASNVTTSCFQYRDLGHSLLHLLMLVENSSKCWCRFNVMTLGSSCRNNLGSPLTSLTLWFRSFPAPLN